MQVIQDPRKYYRKLNINISSKTIINLFFIITAHVLYSLHFSYFIIYENKSELELISLLATLFLLAASLYFGSDILGGKLSWKNISNYLQVKDGDWYCPNCSEYRQPSKELMKIDIFDCIRCDTDLVLAMEIDKILPISKPSLLLNSSKSNIFKFLFVYVLYLVGYTYFYFYISWFVDNSISNTPDGFTLFVGFFLASMIFVLTLFYLLHNLNQENKYLEIFDEFIVVRSNFRHYVLYWDDIEQVIFKHRIKNNPDNPVKITIKNKYYNEVNLTMFGFSDPNFVLNELIPILKENDKNFKIEYVPSRRKSGNY